MATRLMDAVVPRVKTISSDAEALRNFLTVSLVSLYFSVAKIAER